MHIFIYFPKKKTKNPIFNKENRSLLENVRYSPFAALFRANTLPNCGSDRESHPRDRRGRKYIRNFQLRPAKNGRTKIFFDFTYGANLQYRRLDTIINLINRRQRFFVIQGRQ